MEGSNTPTKYYSIKFVCRATGLSRAMLLSLEKNGMLTPGKVNPETGYRYYSMWEVSRVMQYKALRYMGLSQTEIADYNSKRMDLTELLESLKVRQQMYTRSIEELSLRLDNTQNCTFSFLTLPESLCYCKTGHFVTPHDTEAFTVRLYEEVLEKGYEVLATEPLFAIRDDTRTHPIGNPDKPYTSIPCIPLVPSSIPKNTHDENLRVIPGAYVFSMLYYGDYNAEGHFNAGFDRFWQEVDKRGISPTGPLRALGIVCPYVGRDIDPDHYVFRFAVPVDRMAAIEHLDG